MEKEAAAEEVKFVVKDALERNGTLDEVPAHLQIITPRHCNYLIHVYIYIPVYARSCAYACVSVFYF